MRSVSLAAAALAIACQLVSCLALPSENNNSSADEFDGILRSDKIFVGRENGTSFGIWIEDDDRVEGLERKVYEITGTPPKRQRLSRGKSVLAQGSFLTNYRFKAGTHVTLTTWPNDGRTVTSFYVITPGRERLTISTHLSDSVASLKETVTKWTNIPSKYQRLILKGKELQDTRLLLDYDIWNGTSLHMEKPIDSYRGQVKIYLKTLSGVTVHLNIDLADRVESLMEKIQELTGAPRFVLVLMFDGLILSEPDFLCDYGIEAGSHLYLAFSCRQLKNNFSLLERIRAASKAPIFHVASEDQEGELDSAWRSIYYDPRNWAKYKLREEAHTVFTRLNVMAPYLVPNPDDEGWMEWTKNQVRHYDPEDPWTRKSLLARYKIATILRSYRAGKGKTPGRERPCIKLGATWDPDYPLGANINNFAPNGFTDGEIMFLFEFIEKVRRQLKSDAESGEDRRLDWPKQRFYNSALLRVYVEAVAGVPLANEDRYQPPENEDCAICRDPLQVEPSFEPPCGHSYHIDCLMDWISELHSEQENGRCPYCREPFRFSFATYVKDELDWLNESK